MTEPLVPDTANYSADEPVAAPTVKKPRAPRKTAQAQLILFPILCTPSFSRAPLRAAR